MIFTRRFGALAARPQFPDAPELQLEQEFDTDVELTDHRHDDDDLQKVGSSAA
ncbi:MAG TPA: hypothetical protein VGD15_13900 [Kribbella sp.]|jgi:hypothetical protein